MTEALQEIFPIVETDQDYLALVVDGAQPEVAEKPPTQLTPEQRRLAEDNVALVILVVNHAKRLHLSIDYDEALLDGALGLCKAAARFDSEMGTQFNTYATPVIQGAIFDGIREYNGIKEDRHNSATNRHSQATVVSLFNNTWARSIDAPILVDGDGTTVSFGDYAADQAPGPEEVIIDAEQADALQQHTQKLSPRLQQVIAGHLAGVSRAEIGSQFGVCESRATQLYGDAVRELQKHYELPEANKRLTVEEKIINLLRTQPDQTITLRSRGGIGDLQRQLHAPTDSGVRQMLSRMVRQGLVQKTSSSENRELVYTLSDSSTETGQLATPA